jgi:methionyl-tRNA formyltransferase
MLEILKSGHLLVAVYTRAPAPGGRRGLGVKKTPIHLAADSFGFPVFTPTTLRGVQSQEVFSSLAADVGVVAAYGLLLPIPILEAPRLGCVNLHASLLPRWRGAAPIQRAIMAGDAQTGVDVMRMDAGLDTGPIAMREIVPIRPEDTTGDLTSRLAIIAAKLSVSALQSIESGRLEFRAQSTVGVCYAHKIEKSEADIDWTQGVESVINQIHGLSPTPGAYSKVLIGDRYESIKFLRAEVAAGTGSPYEFFRGNDRVKQQCAAVNYGAAQSSLLEWSSRNPVGLQSLPQHEFELLLATVRGSQDLAGPEKVQDREMLHLGPH